jgi:N-acetylneuraminate synthase
VLAEMKQRYGVEIGLSDHTSDCAAAFASAALGATAIEKHVTFSKLMYGSDARHSMEPRDFLAFCEGLKAIWTMLEHNVDKNDLSTFSEMKYVFEKSLVSRRALKKGQTVAREDLGAKKAGAGIPVANYRQVVGRRVLRDIPQNTRLSIDAFEQEGSGAG